MAEAAEDGVDDADLNALIALQPQNRIIQGIVKVNFQYMQKRTLMLEALHSTKGPDINAPYNIVRAMNYFALKYHNILTPSRQTFMRVRDEFIAYAAPLIPRNERTSVVKQRIRREVNEIFDQNERQSARGVARQLRANRETTRQVANEERNPYKDKVVHQLQPVDPNRRLRHAHCMLRHIRANPEFLRFVCFTDESVFTKDKVANRQIIRNWYRKGQNRPTVYPRDRQNRWSLMCFGGVLGDRVIGPYFFNQSLTRQRYCQFLRETFPTMFRGAGVDPRQIWWQQDGAPPHNSIGTTNLLNHRFGNHWFGINGPHKWPTRSPDLTPCDMFLWGHIKNKCYEQPATTPEDMMRRIRREFRNITPEMLRKTRANLERRLHAIIEENGNNIEHRRI